MSLEQQPFEIVEVVVQRWSEVFLNIDELLLSKCACLVAITCASSDFTTTTAGTGITHTAKVKARQEDKEGVKWLVVVYKCVSVLSLAAVLGTFASLHCLPYKLSESPQCCPPPPATTWWVLHFNYYYLLLLVLLSVDVFLLFLFFFLSFPFASHIFVSFGWKALCWGGGSLSPAYTHTHTIPIFSLYWQTC